MEGPLYVTFCFSLVFPCFQFDYNLSHCAPPWIYPAWDTQHFLDKIVYFLSHDRVVFSYYLLKYFLGSSLSLFSFWHPNNANVVPKVSYAIFIFFFIFSKFCSVVVISIILLPGWLCVLLLQLFGY